MFIAYIQTLIPCGIRVGLQAFHKYIPFTNFINPRKLSHYALCEHLYSIVKVNNYNLII